MTKRLLSILFASVVLFSCNKKHDGTDYALSGVHDVDLGDPANQEMMVKVTYDQHVKHERVTLSVAGLPEGVTAGISNPSDTADFTSYIGFANRYIADVRGTHDIKVVATSASGTQSQNAKLTIPGLDGFVVNGFKTKIGYVEMQQATSIYPPVIFAADDQFAGNASLTISFNQTRPMNTVNGIFKIVDNPTADDEVSMYVYYSNSSSNIVRAINSGAKLEISYVNGKMKFKGYNIQVQQFGSNVPMSIDFTEP